MWKSPIRNSRLVIFQRNFSEAEDLFAWIRDCLKFRRRIIAYQNFITGMELGETINVHADGYLYGEGGGYTARPEEVAYLTMRLASKPTFLKDRCRKVVSVDFKLLSAM